MEMRYELYCRADPVFYDAPPAGEAAGPDFEAAGRPVPAGWTRARQGDWVVCRPPTGSPPDQGWKIHVSARLDDAAEILDRTAAYCFGRRLTFKFLRSPAVLHLRDGKYADPAASGKFIAVYPGDERELETAVGGLAEALDGLRGPDVPSDLRCGPAPVHVRYGAIAERHCPSPDGRPVPALRAPDGVLVPDVRAASFTPPPWVPLPGFLRPYAEEAERAAAALPYVPEAVLHLTNGGGVHLARDPRTGEQVVLKEARAHAGLDALGADATARLERERAALERLAGLGVAPALRDDVTAGRRRVLVLERVAGEPLDRAFAARYPLGGARPGDLAAYVDWVTGICAAVEDAVTVIHENGLVHGGLTPGDVIVRPDGGVTLVDFERAAPVGEAADVEPPLGLRPGLSGLDADRHALACLRLALFLPLTELFALDAGKAAELADVIRRLFPVPEAFVRPAARVAGRGPRRKAPETTGWRQMRASMADAVLASATPGRDDRLFPGDPAQFARPGAGLGLAHGAAGVLYALHATGAEVRPEHERWLVERALRAGGDVPPGFFDGLHGVAHTLARLGHREAALQVLETVSARPWRDLGPGLYGGLSGIGLNQICLGALDDALETADLVAARPPRLSGPAGLMHGPSGAALLFLRLFEKTGDARWLDEAERAIRDDLRRCVRQADGSLQVNEGWRTSPYLGGGAVGIAWVLGDLLHYRPDPDLAAARARLDLAARAPFYLQSGLFAGRAGIIAYLCRDRAGGWGREDPEAARQLAALSWHAVGHEGHLAFPGERLLRLSMDLATGTAGVLLAAGAALHGEPAGLPFLGGAMPAHPLRRPSTTVA
ncbi:hypothetical protein MPTA5024_35650 [Microbispora sp. ATCC PTA-5024]|nr:hypothetical protein MPTA5024_35650 [Microbispora sp. ATCC PTA-5024]